MQSNPTDAPSTSPLEMTTPTTTLGAGNVALSLSLILLSLLVFIAA
jgi:hypothetical protein